jgi:cobalt/nickel transport system permease protein
MALGLKKTPAEKLPKTALVSAVLFLAALVHVPLGPSSIHLTLLGAAGILLGWSAVPALFVALLLQGILFQFGGLLSLGVNTAVMGSAALAGSLVFGAFRGRLVPLAAFLGGVAAILAGTALATVSLFFSGEELRALAFMLFAANLPLAFVEGAVSAFMLVFLKRMKPEYVPGTV